MRLRLHPEATWARPYAWQEVDTSDLVPLGPPHAVIARDGGLHVAWTDGTTMTICARAPGLCAIDIDRPGMAQAPASGGVVLDPGVRDPDARSGAAAGCGWLRSAGWQLVLDRDGGLCWGPEDGPPAIEWRSLAVAASPAGLRQLADFALAPAESLHGFGARTGPVDRRGGTFDAFAVKVDGPECGDYGGLPMPFVMSSRGAGVFLDNPWPHVAIDAGYECPDRMRWYAPDGPARWWLIAGPTPTAIQRRWHRLTGAPALPPPWYLGLWMSFVNQTTAEQWRGWIDRFRAEGWPLDAIVLDLEWRGGMQILRHEGGDGLGLDWDPVFGDGPGLIRHAAAADVQVCLHCNTRQFGAAQRRHGVAEGWLREVGEQAVLETTDPAAADAAWAVHAPRIAEGAAAWWTDNGERVDGTLGDGLPSRNLFGQRWNAFLFQRTAAAGAPGRLVITRGDWVGAQRHAAPWPGDTCPGVDRLDEDLRFILNGAISGIPFCGTDLGGFRDIKDDGERMEARMRGRENLVRRVIHGFLYQPIIRIHNAGPTEKFPWTLPSALQELWRAYLGLRYRLLPTLRTAAVVACRDGVPMVRPAWWDFPEQRELRALDDHLLVASGLLVVPVVRDAAWERRVRLPAAGWYRFWDGMPISGGREHVVDASGDAIDGLPVFVRAGTVLAYGPPADRCPSVPSDRLRLDAYPGADGAGELVWDPGEGAILQWLLSGSHLALRAGRRALTLDIRCGDREERIALTPDQSCRIHIGSGAIGSRPLPI